MSRSEKNNPWLKAMGIESSPAYTGECGCKCCCTGIKRAVKRQEHRAERRTIDAEIRFQIDAEDAALDITEEIDAWPYGPIEYPA